MSTEIPPRTQQTIDNTIDAYFDQLHADGECSDIPTESEIASIVHMLLNEYTNGNQEESKHAVDYFIQCSVENVQFAEQLKTVMYLFRDLNTSHKELMAEVKELKHSLKTLRAEHECLMEEYLS